MRLKALFEGVCPNCGGRISDIRLSMGIPCRNCLPIPDEELVEKLKGMSKDEVVSFCVKKLKELGRLRHYKDLADLLIKLADFEAFFRKALGSPPWSAQRTWARRALMGRSFAIIAPTGSGKTVFGSILALYLASRGKKSYIILPTSLLVKQVSERLVALAEKCCPSAKVAFYHSMLSKKKAEEAIRAISEGDFNILVTTSFFLSRRQELLLGQKFDFIFVDDVDAFLRSSKNVDVVLMLLGIPREAIEGALELLGLKRELSKLLRAKRAEKEKLDAIRERILEIEAGLEAMRSRLDIGMLIVSGATIRAKRTKRIRLFRELLGFELGGRAEGLRNVANVYAVPKGPVEDEVLRLVRELGPGGLVFVPLDRGSAYAEELADFLRQNGIRAEAFTRARKKVVDAYVAGDLDVLVGVASFRSPLARGIDLPARIRYAVFAGVPKIRISLSLAEFRPHRAVILLANLRDLLAGEEADRADAYIAKIRNYISMLRKDELKEVVQALSEGRKLSGFLEHVRAFFSEVWSFLRDLLARPDVVQAIRESPHLSLDEVEGEPYLLVPDPVGYLQASGRTSRLYAGGISRGLSVLVVDDEKAFNGLRRALRWYAEDEDWQSLEEADLKAIMAEVDRDRELIRRLLSGELAIELKDPMKTALLVVESPTKARTIARFFGRPSKREVGPLTVFETTTGDFFLSVVASKGHVFDLVTKGGFHGVEVHDGHFIPIYGTIKRCRKCGEQYTDDLEACPRCGSKLDDKAELLRALAEVAKEVDVLLVGTDADAEGEKIGWDIATFLAPYVREIRRVEFHEITRRALMEALKNPREIDERLVEAQILRRIEDRWIGFELSQKLQSYFRRKNLSAGRVQTPVLRWIAERCRQWKKSFRDCFGLELENGLRVVLRLPRMSARQVRATIERLRGASCYIKRVELEEVELAPPPPFTTDAMLREASARLKMGAREVMALAQELFEVGLITYHRTDSTRVSSAGIRVAREYISERWGEELLAPRTWATGEEGAHECIRPTRPIDAQRLRQLIQMGVIRLARRLSREHFRLYDLIFKRFIASQMKKAKLLKQKAVVAVEGQELTVEGYCEIIEPGFTHIRPVRLIPRASEGPVRVKEVRHWIEAEVKPFTEGELVALMKERGIGRPSTYAKIITTLLEREYVKRGRGGRLYATQRGYQVLNYLDGRFSQYVSEETTRRLEEAMKAVEEGRASYIEILRRLYEEIRILSGVA
ncbi:MAG TPA: reverse gyrase [Candidatus Bathyarchaeota archaeon]|nr:reverse gyrase [Candidatus Bathyarchaeota archaeon]